MPNFEVLDAKIASALNRIIHNTQFKRRISLEEQKAQKQDRFLRGRQIAYMIYEYFRVSGAHHNVFNYAYPFSITLRNHSVQDFDTRWNEILLSMSKFPTDEVLESLYKKRIRESDQLKTVWELYDLEIHKKIPEPDYQRLKTMVKRSRPIFSKRHPWFATQTLGLLIWACLSGQIQTLARAYVDRP